ncbi:MAG TPA: GNAT family N-acyltransferase [Terriglobales bacterium]|nr:GNAT family N-acyltransferase [Terriglobales bacterium]
MADEVTTRLATSSVKPALLTAPNRNASLKGEASSYRMRFAETREDLEGAYRLRFLVFNLELGEGPESAYQDGYERDEFDEVCDHLLIEDARSRQIVGTYRLQTGAAAARNNLGYYSAREFDFTPYEPLREKLVELGRACIHRDHRSFEVLTLLWRGIAAYAQERRARYLVGCSSLTSQSPSEGLVIYSQLQDFLVEPSLQTVPLPAYELPVDEHGSLRSDLRPPKLLRAYLSIGARICGIPAIDRAFKTIDFLTLLDLEAIYSGARARFLGSAK